MLELEDAGRSREEGDVDRWTAEVDMDDGEDEDDGADDDDDEINFPSRTESLSGPLPSVLLSPSLVNVGRMLFPRLR